MAGPTTAFERSTSANANWTSVPDQGAFLQAVTTGSEGRAVLSSQGRTLQGRDIWLMRVGYPAPRAVPLAPILYVCGVHGREPDSIEASMMFARDLAYSSDPAIIEFLTNHDVWIMPNVNPDGRAANTRANSAGFDINRTYADLATAEARAVQEAVRDCVPLLVYDGHESGTDNGNDLELQASRNPNTHPAIVQAGGFLLNSYLIPRLAGRGFKAAEYTNVIFPESNLHEGTCSNAVGLRHTVGVIFETIQADTRKFRVSAHSAGMVVMREFLRDHFPALQIAGAASRTGKVVEGQFGTRRFDLVEGGQVDAPAGYRLTAAQQAATQLHRTVFDIGIDGDVIGMGQPAQPLIPFLFDAVAPRRIVGAVTVPRAATGALQVRHYYRWRDVQAGPRMNYTDLDPIRG